MEENDKTSEELLYAACKEVHQQKKRHRNHLTINWKEAQGSLSSNRNSNPMTPRGNKMY